MNDQFDEKIVGQNQSNNDFLMKMEEEYNKAKEHEMEEEKKPLVERVKSKNWKTRKNAYIEMLKNIKNAKSRTDPIYQEYSIFYNEILEDPHSSAQESALELVRQVLENYENVDHMIPEFFKIVLEKCYTSSKSQLKQFAKEFLILSVEMTENITNINEILKTQLESKNPKIQQASLNILTHLISLFGCFTIDYRNLITQIEKLTESTTPTLRTETLEFYKELFKWIKDSIKPYISRLKESHQKELEKSFDELKNTQPHPIKKLKIDKNKSDNTYDSFQVQSKLLLMKEEEKMFKNTEAVELFQGKFNETWTEEIQLKDKKWSDKRDMLENFITASNVLKISNSPRAHIIVAFQKLLKDSNINVVNSTILAICNMGKGLRKDFIEAREFLIPILEKFKEKKEKLNNDVVICLEALMMHCINIEEVIEDLKNFINNEKIQTSQSKERFCKFIEKIFLTTVISLLRKVGYHLADMMFKLSDDACADVRNSALNTLGVIKFRIGDMPLSKILNEICDLKKKKVDDAAKNVVIDPIYDKDDTINKNKKLNVNNNVGNPTNIKPKENLPVTNNTMKNRMDIEMNNIQEVKNTKIELELARVVQDVEMSLESNNLNAKVNTMKPTNNNLKKVPAPANTNVTNIKSSNTANINNELEQEEDSNLSNEDLEQIMKEKLGQETINMFNDAKWDARKNAFINLTKYISDNADDANKHIDTIMRFIKLKLKDYKEINFNILNEAIAAIQILCELCGNFAKKNCIICVKRLSEKMGEVKLKSGILNLFFKLMEYHGPKYISNILLKHMTNNVKSPQALKEFASFLEKVIEEFGISTLPIKELVEFGKFLAGNSNPQLRTSASTLLCCIYKYIGPNIKKFLTDIKEATLKVIESEFEKVTVINENIVKRELKGSAALETCASGNLIDNLFPRVDISKKILPKFIKELNEGKWQTKKETLESLEKIFTEANMRILPNGLNELVTSLKNKLDDGNKNLVRILIQFITKMIEALGSGSKSFSKILLKPILNNLSDKMNLLREDIVKCIEKWSEFIGFENVLIFCPQYLVIENFELRTDLLKLIIKHKNSLIKYDSRELIPGVIACLQDKTPSIRILAEELAREMLRIVNINNFYAAMKDLKPAIAATIKGIVDKYSSLICVDSVFSDNIEPKEVVNVNKNTCIISGNLNPNPNPTTKTHSDRSISVPNKAAKIIPVNNSHINKRDSSSSIENNDSKGKLKKSTVTTTSSLPNIKPLPKEEVNVNPVVKTPIPLLISCNIKINQKQRRLESEKIKIFPNEYITQEYEGSLKMIMSQFINKSYLDNAFSNEITKYNSVFTSISNTMKSDPVLFFEITDIWLKWILIRNLEMNNNLFFNNIIFDFFKNLLEYLRENECSLYDTENKILIEVFTSKFFTMNVLTKNKAKQFLNDYLASLMIKYDMILEIISDKFSSINDSSIKSELFDLLNSTSLSKNYILNDVKNLRFLTNMYNQYIENNSVKKMIYELTRNVYTNNFEKEKMNDILKKGGKSLSELIEIKKNEEVNLQEEIKFSHSPLLSLKRLKNNEDNNSKESINIKLIVVIDQNKINQLLDNLYSKNFSEKTKILIELNDIFTDKFKECVLILEKNIDQIIKSFTNLMKLIFSQSQFDQELIEILKYLLIVFYKAALTKDIIEHCNIETIYNTFEEIIKAILYENLENVGSEDEGKKIIKSLNALILKLMENFNPTSNFLALIKLIQNYRTDNSRVCSLSIKCLLKISNIMPSLINNINIEQILIGIYQFIDDFEMSNPDFTPKTQIEEMCIKILRTVVNEIIKIRNEGIWNSYKMGIERNNLPDKHLKRWIQLILRSKNGLSIPGIAMNSTNDSSSCSPIHSLYNNNITNSNCKSQLVNSAFSLNNNNTNSSHLNNFENELNFYIDKIKPNQGNPNNQIEIEKILYEVIAILRRNKLTIDIIKDKVDDGIFCLAKNIFYAVASTLDIDSKSHNLENNNKVSVNYNNCNLEKVSSYKNNHFKHL